MSGASDPSTWNAAMHALAEAGDRIAERLRASGREADVPGLSATMLGVLMNVWLNDIAVQAEHPVFVPSTGYFQRLGTPNPDTVYRSAPIDEDGTYRIVGNRGSARDVTLMAFSAQMRSWPACDIAEFCGGEGGFDFVASKVRPDGYDGHWLPIEPGTATLWMRSVADDWAGQVDPWIAISRLDGAARGTLDTDWMDARLATLATRVERMVAYGIDHVEQLVCEGFVNRLKEIDYGASGGMPLQSYHEGVFRLGDDEALLIEARMPGNADYFSWSLTDALFVTLDWTNAFTSLNSAQAKVDADGVLRVVLSRQDPGVENWLQTCAHASGVLQCRTIGSDEATQIEASVVPISRLAELMPRQSGVVDEAGRRRMLQARQLSAQHRRLW